MPSGVSAKLLRMPTYKRLEADLRARLARGEWTAGSMLPGRRELALEYGVEVATLQRAIGALLKDGTLRADQRRGTFVTKPPETMIPAPLTSSISSYASPANAGVLGLICANYPLNPWTTRIARAIEKQHSQFGGSIRMYTPQEFNSPKIDMPTAVASLSAQGCAAIVVILLQTEDDEDVIDETTALLDGTGIRVVFLTHWQVRRPVYNVCYDSFDAGYQAAKHLIDQGCRRILFMHSLPVSSWSTRRFEGARRAVTDARLSTAIEGFAVADPIETKSSGLYPSEYIAVAALIFQERLTHDLPDGIIAANDNYSVELMRAASNNGLTAGRDFLLIGFDDEPDSRAFGLSTLCPPLEEMGAQAAHLLHQVEESNTHMRRVCLLSHPIFRDSTRARAQPGL
jgi:DNA-binding LacI/PurR family transcriptional regulator/DNA-binding transcriptional regulator YhcF (GntR family)